MGRMGNKNQKDLKAVRMKEEQEQEMMAKLKEAVVDANLNNYLSLEDMQLSLLPYSLPTELNLGKVTILDLSSNNFTKLPNMLEQFTNLVTLELAQNKIESFELPVVFPKLEKLNLSLNPLVQLPADLEMKAPKLLNLNIYCCKLKQIPVESIMKMPGLTVLVQGNSLSTHPDDLPRGLNSRLTGLYDQYIPSEIIKDFLYLGSASSAVNWDSFEERKITHVVCMTSMYEYSFEDRIVHKKFIVDDLETSNIAQFFDEINALLDECKENNKVVLVHCAAGVSRSATAVIAYLMARQNLTLKDATEYVLNRRPCIGPNRGFLQQLAIYEAQLFTNRAHQ